MLFVPDDQFNFLLYLQAKGKPDNMQIMTKVGIDMNNWKDIDIKSNTFNKWEMFNETTKVQVYPFYLKTYKSNNI